MVTVWSRFADDGGRAEDGGGRRMFGIPLGLLYANAGEWLIHKYVLHERGRRKGGFWGFHWLEHHRKVRLHAFEDPDYRRSVIGTHGQGKEALMLGVAAVAHAPLFPVAPFFTATVMWSAWDYYRKHKRAHLDPEWAREHLPWHYDHHMGPDQDENWCVTRPWFDLLMGTRVPYVGTPRELEDRARAQRAKERREQRQRELSVPAETPARAA
jgi:sterol desaturase/sphingolipid hydroxylase (fatty acid hydroxylase superfamily)